MTIRRHESWGSPGDVPSDIEWCDSDHGLAEAVSRGRPVIGVAAGDLARTVGAVGRGTRGVLVPLDAIEVTIERGSSHETSIAMAHCLSRSPWWRGGWWRGEATAIMNAQFVGEWDVAPRGHPNDGRLDVVSIDRVMPKRQRWSAWRRLPRGEHIPHPMITVASAADPISGGPGVLEIDGRSVGRVDRWTVRVLADHVSVWVALPE